MFDWIRKFLDRPAGPSKEPTASSGSGSSGRIQASKSTAAPAPFSMVDKPVRYDPSAPQQPAPRQQLSATRGWAPMQGQGIQAPRQLSPTRGWAYDQSAQASQYTPPVGGQSPRVKEQAEREQRNKDRQLASDYDQQLGGNDDVTAVEMDWSSYQALNPRQRAAVDLNTELLSAVNADKADTTASVTREYRDMSEKLFGQDRGSDIVAPRTVALLNELGHMTTGAPQDLDQYLGLQALVDTDDLNFLTDEGAASTRAALDKTGGTSRYGEGGVNARAENALLFGEAAKTRLAQTLQAGNGLIGKVQSDTDFGAKLFGGPTSALGFNPTIERDQALQSIFDTMARRDATFADNELSEALGSFSETFGVDNEQLVQFFETRLKAAEYGDQPIGQDPAGQYLNPGEFRTRYYNGDK